MNEFSFSKDFLEKIASLVTESGETIKHVTEVGRNLLEDNERLAAENEALKLEKYATERAVLINDTVEELNIRGLISKTAMPSKREELNKWADDQLHQFNSTIKSLNSTQTEKAASEGIFSTCDFLEASAYNQLLNDGRPRPLSLD